MRFQVEENIKDWLISGQKRGDFKAKVRGFFVYFVAPLWILMTTQGWFNAQSYSHTYGTSPWRTTTPIYTSIRIPR